MASRQSPSVSLTEARRIALTAQGFSAARPSGGVTERRVLSCIRRLGLLQIDSVNVLARAHYLPLLARLGPYDIGLLPTLAYGPRKLVEYWAHEASYVPVETQPLLRWRMERARTKQETWGRMARLAADRPGFVQAVLAEVRDRGPIGVADLGPDGAGSGEWWGWSDAKVALEWLFWVGEITAHHRGTGFQRVYDLTERVLPPAVLAVPTPSEGDAIRDLLRISARAHGIATEPDLRDYFRLKGQQSQPRIAELVESGELAQLSVEGWRHPAYLWHEAAAPRRISARALLAPFDPLVFERSRTERLFGMRYRIEIYVPAAQRVHGYYVLPFLLGDELVARVDLKADRATGRLLVQSVHLEPSRASLADVIGALSAELREMADWLGLGHGPVVVGAGAAARALAVEVGG